jgi:hypothetical protein
LVSEVRKAFGEEAKVMTLPAAMTRFTKETGIKINEKGELDRPCCELDRREQKFELV